MTTYAEFRLILSPDLGNQGNWSVTVDDCPIPGLIGPKGSVTPVLTRAHLDALRSRHGWPNSDALRQIGAAVWQSTLSGTAEAAFAASRQAAERLRFVLVVQGQENEVVDPARIWLSELPVEALYRESEGFLATDITTPISRSFQWKPDRQPERVALPLRVLVVVSGPSDKPPANIEQEAETIRDTVAHLTAARILDMDFVQQATPSAVFARLKAKPYHILHFIGHGGFDVVGDQETPRAHLCFVRPDSGLSHPIDAETLSIMLKNSGVRLVVITACSSAAPTPPFPGDFLNAGPLGTRAFNGVAQRTVSGGTGVTAAVAMQFDLEDVGAKPFSKAFYENLLQPGRALDEIVTMAREELAVQLSSGHRAWVTPVVYWRCQGGRVFEIEPSVQPLDDATLEELHNIDVQLAVYREWLGKLSDQPPEERRDVAPLRSSWIAEVEQLMSQRAKLFGDSLRLCGARVAAGQETTCRLSVRMRQPGTITLIQFRLEYSDDMVAFVGSHVGADAAVPPATAVVGAGAVHVVLGNPAAGRPWMDQEYELGFLRFLVRQGVPPALIDVHLTALEVIRDGQQVTLTPVDGVLFVE